MKRVRQWFGRVWRSMVNIPVQWDEEAPVWVNEASNIERAKRSEPR